MSALGARLSDLASDLRLAVRTLAKTPTFSVVAVLVLAVAVGANTAIFSVVRPLLLEPLPLPDSDRLVAGNGLDAEGREQWLSYPDFEDLRAQARSLAGYSAFVPQSVNLTDREQPERVRGGFVSDGFFAVLGVEAAIGRGFLPGVDDREGAERVCVLQHEAWHRLFGADETVLGRSIQLNNEPFTVVGVLSDGFRFPLDEIEVWIPHHHWPVHRGAVESGRIGSRAFGMVGGIGRLRHGVDIAEARGELDELFGRLSRAYPEAGVRSMRIRPLQELVVGHVRLPMLVLAGAVAFVLDIACANVASLLLVRGANRSPELATRAALGASRGRLARQLLTETAVLWAAGGALGLVLGSWLLKLLLLAAPGELPGGLVARFDGAVLLFALLLTAASASLFGAFPAWRAGSTEPAATLAMATRSAVGAASSPRLRSILVAAQVALTLVLLVGAGLVLRSFSRLMAVDTGFRADGVLSMEYRLPQNKYRQSAAQWEAHRRILDEVRQAPGVLSAALVSGLPFSGNGGTLGIELVGGEAAGQTLRARALTVSDGYFETLGIELLRGRPLAARDRADAPPVVVISKMLADRHFAGQDALGRRLAIVDGEERFEVEIVGVVADTRQYELDEEILPAIYGAQAQSPGIFNTLAVRTAGDPMRHVEPVRAAVWAVDPEQPVWKIRTLASLVERSAGLPRFLARLLTAYAGIALLLAAIGIYGVVATLVAQRRREIGLRVALGAQRRDVLRLVVGHGLRWAAVGVGGGLAAALALGKLLSSLLYRTESSDPPTFLAVAALVALVALTASYLPARSAAAIDPARTLRAE